METREPDSRAKEFASKRQQLGRLIRRRGFTNEAVLDAILQVSREQFVPDDFRDQAYFDQPLPIGKNQTISQPFVVAMMTDALSLGPSDRVLEIGTGSGYAAAVISRIAKHVDTVERHVELAESAARRLAQLGYDNVQVHFGDGTHGWPERAPYDAIVVAAGGPQVPPSLTDQLAVGGRLVMPVGKHRSVQQLIRMRRLSEDRFEEEDLGGVSFVPLVGAAGWDAADSSFPSTRARR
ncbi:protein-L-isoaspartate(D-aspartate) O-methyltransferase [Roseiconus nitratireducens]|uniref:Protein-L-isoaspartate O-methyltransferase n=1 Tax=Roseiconus nitratireducens TaxID=2605748 RepID=A0A5M6D744_9BACT|nr:protein-L-isoaspartate(D-aspartate) O-methyltransferase [Roseiconus nitratireducens]KAA5543203.1 protein-L-isoaspartate(D-aspartate) O-methyltransferase [Roseiconus nitratireducens]